MKLRHILGTAIGATLGLLALPANAAGTLAETPISNTASVTYEVATVAQGPVNSNSTSFVVDRKVDLTVDEVDGTYRPVVNGDTAEYLTFTVTNDGNQTMDFRLFATTAGITDPHGGTDNYDQALLAPATYVDSNSNGVYDPGVDTATYIESLGPDLSATVFIVADTISGTAGQISAHQLTAVAALNTVGATGAANPNGGALDADLAETNTGVTNESTPGFIDTVFTDSATDGTGATDGRDAASDAFQVVNAQLTVTKSHQVISDPVNGTTNPKAIPGAFVRYVVTITNNTPDQADNVSISDTIPTNTAYDDDSLFVDDNDGNGLESEPDADSLGVDEVAGVITGTIGNLPAGDDFVVQYNVRIQ